MRKRLGEFATLHSEKFRLISLDACPPFLLERPEVALRKLGVRVPMGGYGKPAANKSSMRRKPLNGVVM